MYIPIHKKGTKTKCSNYRRIALISHASKVMLNIINERIKLYLLLEIAPEQAGFVPGRGTRNQISNMRQIIKKVREYNKAVYLCFIDYEKAFDNVKWKILWKRLRKLGTSVYLIKFIKSPYDNNSA